MPPLPPYNPYVWRCAERRLALDGRTRIMGILNVTRDSFSDGGRFLARDDALRQAERMIDEGADIIDVGGESTRPGALPVDAEEEIRRVIPVIGAIGKRFDVLLSVDTYKSAVARAAVENGARIINDISGLGFDPHLADVAATSGAGVVIMHIKGTPRDMQTDPHYEDVVAEIHDYLSQRIQTALAHGIHRDQIMLDPGIGFGKRLEDNLTLLRELARLHDLDAPLLVGVSRKSFIGKLLDTGVGERLEGTAAAVTAAILHGAHVMRVHDVREMKRVATIADAIRGV